MPPHRRARIGHQHWRNRSKKSTLSLSDIIGYISTLLWMIGCIFIFLWKIICIFIFLWKIVSFIFSIHKVIGVFAWKILKHLFGGGSSSTAEGAILPRSSSSARTYPVTRGNSNFKWIIQHWITFLVVSFAGYVYLSSVLQNPEFTV